MARSHRFTRSVALAAVAAVALALTGCTGAGPAPGPTTAPSTAAPRATTSPPPGAFERPVTPVGTPTDVQTGLAAPWSMVRLPSGSTLVSERDSGRIIEVLPGGRSKRVVGTVPGVVHVGEGGLLGLAVPKARPRNRPGFLYAYLTTRTDNRVVRMPLRGEPGSYALGAPTSVIDGIPKGPIHNGGRIAFGPDGMLYITTGDADNHGNAQNLHSLGGKILRVTPTGGIPSGNPFPDSPVYSYGHRNPQGLAWDSHGRLWASEFGQNRWDELNIIQPGGDYGWPVVEGIAHDSRYIDPVHQWRTDVASPSGIAITHDTIFMAGLGGRRLWVITPHVSRGSRVTVTASSTLLGTLGRLRDVLVSDPGAGAAGPNQKAGTIWLLTNNTDGRGTPRPGDDRIVALNLRTATGQ
jgi:glucose/arabinose dehydrogenase